MLVNRFESMSPPGRPMRWFVVLALVLISTATLGAQTPAVEISPRLGPSLSGKVTDETGAVMQAVDVRIFEGDSTEPLVVVTTDTEGVFSIDLPEGEYRMEVVAPAFATFIETVRVVEGMEPLPVTLALDVVRQEIDVDTEAAELSLADTSMSLTSQRLSGDQLLNLPDNEEDLAMYLLLLAGADTTGDLEEDVLRSFIIDGFDNGRLPSLDQIAQIIVDPNSLSADGSGPRIEIVTRPGTGRWRRSVDFSFADESLNALTPGEGVKAPRQTRNTNIEFGGPIIANLLEMNFELSNRFDERAANSLRAITPDGDFFEGVVRPQLRRSIEIDGEIELASNHSLDIGYEYERGHTDNSGVGGFSLPERGSSDNNREWSFSVSERTFGDNHTNDIRFQVNKEYSRQVPVSSGVAINVADAFRGGGGTNRNVEEETVVQLEDQLRFERGEWNFRFGVEGIYQRNNSISENNYNGTFQFSSLHDYCYATNFAGINCQETSAVAAAAQAQGITPTYLDARGREVRITGAPTTFTQRSGNAEFDISRLALETYFQADRAFGERASLRLGVRYEVSNHSVDYLRANPTVNVSYRVFEKTIVSAGAQVNFRDFRSYEQLLRNDGVTYQKQLSISRPSFPDPFVGGVGEVDALSTSLYVLDPDYQSPYNISPQVNINQELPGSMRVTVSYSLNFGIHQQRTRNINAPYPGTPLPVEILDLPRSRQREVVDRMRPFYPVIGNISQIESTGRSESHTLRLRFQRRRQIELLGFRFSGSFDYTYRSANDDNDFNNPYVREWGRSRRDQEVRSQFSVRMPESAGIQNTILKFLADSTYSGTYVNFSLRANRGRLYSIRSGVDLNGDQSTRDRPVGTPRNSEVGPGFWNVDMTFTKDFRMGGQASSQGGRGNFAQGRGGGRRGGGFGGQSGETRLRFRARFGNLFNHSQPRSFSGVVTSPFFGLPTGFTGGRTITLAMNLDF